LYFVFQFDYTDKLDKYWLLH